MAGSRDIPGLQSLSSSRCSRCEPVGLGRRRVIRLLRCCLSTTWCIRHQHWLQTTDSFAVDDALHSHGSLFAVQLACSGKVSVDEVQHGLLMLLHLTHHFVVVRLCAQLSNCTDTCLYIHLDRDIQDSSWNLHCVSKKRTPIIFSNKFNNLGSI